MGDFNTKFFFADKYRNDRFAYYASKVMHFNNFIMSNQLLDFAYAGSIHTWCNDQMRLASHWAKFDRILANIAWTSQFATYANRHHSRVTSDHAPLFLLACFFSYRNNSVFRFDNYWLEYNTYHNFVSKAWNSLVTASPLHAFSH